MVQISHLAFFSTVSEVGVVKAGLCMAYHVSSSPLQEYDVLSKLIVAITLCRKK